MSPDESIEERRLLDELAQQHRAERAPEALRARLVERLSREAERGPRTRWALPALAAVVFAVIVSGLFAGRLLERRPGPELALRAEPGAASAPRDAPGCPDYPGVHDAAALLRATGRDVLLAGLGAQAVAQPTARCGAIQRRYLSYVPPSLPRRSRVPVLLLLHGASDSAESLWAVQTRRRFDELASRNSFIAVYASALPVPGRPGESRWQGSGAGAVDDERYLQLVIADLAQRGVIAGGNDVYLVGHAEGAVMALQAAAHRADRYAGVAALMPGVAVAPPAPSPEARLTKVLLVTSDELGANLGAEWALALGVPRSTVSAPLRATLPDAVVEDGAARLPSARAARLPSASAARGSTVESRDMVSLDGKGARVRVLTAAGAGRLWPHPLPDDDARLIEAHGLRNQDFDGADETWRFFSGRGRAGAKDDDAPPSPSPR